MSFLGDLFRRRPRDEAPAPPGGAVITPASRALSTLLELIDRRAEESRAARVLLLGAPTGSLLEVFSGRGARVTVDGEDPPVAPLAQPDAAFDILLVLDLIDFLDDEEVHPLAAEWERVLVPGGRAFLISRSERAAVTRRYRAEARPDGTLDLAPRVGCTAAHRLRGNRELYGLLAPLVLDEILLRRDGLRELMASRARRRGPGGTQH